MKSTAIITGGASGIGQAIARRLADRGHAVAILDLNDVAAKTEAETINANGGTAIGVTVDVADRAAVDTAVARTTEELGAATIMVNSAGLSLHAPFLELSNEQFERIVDVNLVGTFNMCQAVLPAMLDAGWGRIVNVSSSSVHSGAPRLGSYVAAKSGVVGLTKSIALEFAGNGITANAIAPGSIDTPMLRRTVGSGDVPTGFLPPVGRLGTPDDMAGVALYLASDEGGYVTGQHWSINGGRATGGW